MKPYLSFSIVFILVVPAVADDMPEPETVLNSMKRAVSFYRENLSVDGGYASSWSLDPIIGQTETSEGPTVFSIQPHGTTTVGLAMLKAWQATGEKEFLEGAIESGEALAGCQLSSGGWSSDFDWDPVLMAKYHIRKNLDGGDRDAGKRRHRSTLDDNKTQSAIVLLLELAVLPEVKDNEEIQRAWQFGFDSLLAAQRSDGGWPQQFEGPAKPDQPVLKASFPESWPREYPKESYSHLVTLNDGNLYQVMKLLLLVRELTGSTDALDSAKQLGDFLLRAQMPGPQPAWAQQYNGAMHPAWARKFEPPAISSVESLGAAEALFELWIATGESKYRGAIEPALQWLESSQLENGEWARFYELQTNRPLYCEAETYRVTYDDRDLPSHYAFQVGGVDRKIESLRNRLAKSPEQLRKDRLFPKELEARHKLARSFKGKVQHALKTQHPGGFWLRNGRVDAREFVKQMTVLSDYARAINP